jgi:hypothetical protein
MSESGYDPMQMAKFFEKLNASSGQQLQILSDHPNPGNREVAIAAEMKTLPARKYGADTGLFPRVKKEVAALPPPTKKPGANAPAPGGSVPPAGTPSAADGMQSYSGQGFAIRYPQGWQVFGETHATDVTLAPRDGVVQQSGNSQVGFGALIGQFTPQAGRADLRSATSDLIKRLQNENAEISVSSDRQSSTIAGLPAMTTTMRSSSPFGGVEIDTLVTVLRQQKLWYAVFVAPEKDQPRVAGAYKQMLDSLSFP